MHQSHRRHRTSVSLLETLERRQLLSASVSLTTQPPAHFVLQDNSITLIGTLPNAKYTLPDEVINGSSLHATVQWGDGTSSDGILRRDAKGRVQVWAGHAYSALKTYKISVLTDTGSDPKVAMRNSAIVSLNAARGRTINATSGTPFTGVIATLARTDALPLLASPQSSIDLPAGSNFAQYTVGNEGAIAVARIDWGDGTITDASFVSHGGNYNVLGSHTYALGASYRIIVNVIIESSDHTVLHIDMVNSTAHVKGPDLLHFTIPAHAPVDLTTLIPSGTTLTLSNQGTQGSADNTAVTISGGISGGVLTLAGGHLDVPQDFGAGTQSNLTSSGSIVMNNSVGRLLVAGGVLGFIPNPNFGGGTAGTLVLGHGGGSVSLGAGIINLGPGGTVVPILNNTGSGLIVINPTNTGSTLVLSPPISVGLDVGSSLAVTYDAAGNFDLAFLLDPIADRTTELALDLHGISFGANGNIKAVISTIFSGVLATNSSAASMQYLSQIHTGNLIFNLSNSADQVLALLSALPADFAGNVVLPPAASSLTLPDLPATHFLTGITVPSGTTLYMVAASGTYASITLP